MRPAWFVVKAIWQQLGGEPASSQEQSAGIDDIGRAIASMDEMTQQNAALVEEAAAAARRDVPRVYELASTRPFL